MHSQTRPFFGSYSDSSAINIKSMVTDLFGQMRESSPGAAGTESPKFQGSVTRNAGFQMYNSVDHLPWNSPTLAQAKSFDTNITPEERKPLVRSASSSANLTSLCADLSASDSHFFEVLYIGKVRISQRKVPESLIDDALSKLALHEAEKIKRRSSLYTSSSITEETEDDPSCQFKNKEINFNKVGCKSTSTTPLEPDKNFIWKSFDHLSINSSQDNENDKRKTCSPEDSAKNNLGIVKEDEEKGDEIHSIIAQTASSITQFCQSDIFQDLNQSSENSDTEKNIDNLVCKGKEDEHKLKMYKENKRITREDSPAPNFNFNEINRKPKLLIRSQTGLDNGIKKSFMPESTSFLRSRSASIGTVNSKTSMVLIGEPNRTMLFQVGRSELRLISPDRKQILLHRAFKDVASCVLGRINDDHFGFVCREANESYACYVFKCESNTVAKEVINAIKQAFMANAEFMKKSKEKSPNMTCEHCPMLWYHRLCHDCEGLSDKKTHATILRRIEQLSEEEQEIIIMKYQGGTNHMYEVCEHNAFLMMLLRAHCEAKQRRHLHDTAENRSEFLNQYLGGSTIFKKAKRSLSSGFDHLLKRKGSRDDITSQNRKETSPLPTPTIEISDALTTDDSSEHSKKASPTRELNGDCKEEPSKSDKESKTSPMIDIFLKISDSRASGAESGSVDSTWRQAMYEKTLQTPGFFEGDAARKNLLSPKHDKRTKKQLRDLWKMAIEQTILLVRMEKENARIQEKAESSAVRRIKLEYMELGISDAGVIRMWDTLLSREQPMAKIDRHILTQAVLQGVPRNLRGGVWYFLAEQASVRLPPPDVKRFPNYHTPYRTLLAGLTKHQHAILIDLGRTFPQHEYFSSPLGPGQLALYNILKAYSLLDPEVGYCQGLSFIAGVLLLHMEETEAFILLRHLMFRRGLRKQYLPDMSALQVQLYQLSRLIRDVEPELHEKLSSVDISPALYAAPWMLTLFTSQFPLGFVVRVFDLVFLDSLEVVFSISLALLSSHRDGLLMCESCEELAEYLKHKLPDIDRNMYEKVMKKVQSLDISRQLNDYAVEYSVLREEIPRMTSLSEENQNLTSEQLRLSDELDSAMEAISKYQKSQARLESENKAMESQLILLSTFTSNLKLDLPPEIKKIVQIYKKSTFGSKISSLAKFSAHEEDNSKRSKNVSTPNLFSKVTKEDILVAVNKDPCIQENDKKPFLMKKSQSVNFGLVAGKKNALKVLEEKPEIIRRRDSINHEDVLDNHMKNLNKKNLGYFASTYEQIRQERLYEQQLKQDFDENLKKAETESIIDTSSEDAFKCKEEISLHLKSSPKDDTKFSDSGFVTPMTPNDRKDDNGSVVSHPLNDSDVEIKFDGHSTKLKQLKPNKNIGNNGSICHNIS